MSYFLFLFGFIELYREASLFSPDPDFSRSFLSTFFPDRSQHESWKIPTLIAPWSSGEERRNRRNFPPTPHLAAGGQHGQLTHADRFLLLSLECGQLQPSLYSAASWQPLGPCPPSQVSVYTSRASYWSVYTQAEFVIGQCVHKQGFLLVSVYCVHKQDFLLDSVYTSRAS